MVPSILAVLLAFGTAESVRAGGEDALLRKVKEGPEAEGWADAVASLRRGSAQGQEALQEALEHLAASRLHAWRRAAERLDRLAVSIGDGKGDAARLSEWEQARKAACDFVFDQERFPVPEELVIRGPMEGYDEAKRLGDAALRAWGRLDKRLGAQLSTVERLTPKRAERLEVAVAEASQRCRAVTAVLPDAGASVGAAPEVRPLALVLVHLARGDFAEAAKRYAALPAGWERVCLFHAYSSFVLAYDEAHPFDMRKDAVEALRLINEYRMALGISPLRHDERLVKAARKHAEEMLRLDYLSHRSPVEEHASKEQRVALEGYVAGVTECITAAGGGAKAVEFWKYDGGHHRAMVSPGWVDAGMSTRGPATFLGGAGTEGSIPVLRL